VSGAGPGWPGAALAGACGLLLGVIVALALSGGPDRDAPARTVTVAVPATRTTGGTVIVTTRVPALVGERLDTAKARLARARFDADVDGGGLLGILRESNWEVVEQRPPAGTILEQGSTVRVRVDRR
jgi:hypothetical protein